MTVRNDIIAFPIAENVKDYSVSEKKISDKSVKDADFKKTFDVAAAETRDDKVFDKDNVRNTTSDVETDNEVEGKEGLTGKYNRHYEALLSLLTANTSETDEAILAEDALAVLQTLLADIVQMLQDGLEITEQELQNAMDKLGMSEADLLNPDNLTKLVVEIEADGNMAEMLSNEALHDTVANFNEALQNLKAGFEAETGLNLDVVMEEYANAVQAISEEAMNASDDFIVNKSNKDATANDAIFNQNANSDLVTEEMTSVSGAGDARSKESDNGAADADMLGRQNVMTSAELINNIRESLGEITESEISTQVIRQIADRIMLSQNEEMTSMELQLNPEELGKVNLQVVAKDGEVTAKIATETLIAKEMIESQIEILKESLNNQGVEIKAVEVTVAAHQFEANDEQQRERGNEAEESGRRRFIDVEEMNPEEQMDEAIALAREIMMSNGNQMDIRA